MMPSGPDIEIRHGSLKQLYAYWLRRKGDRVAPRRADIDPAEMRKFLRNVFMMDVIGPPPRFKFRVVGTEIVSRFGEEITGQFLDAIDLDDVGPAIINEYELAVRELRPVYGHWEYVKHSGRYMKYERLILPLSSDGKTVDMLIGGACADDSPPPAPSAPS